MDELIQRIKPRWYGRPGATDEAIRAAEAQLGITFPSDYCEFLTWSNGGEGQVGDDYLSLWPIEEAPQLNEDYQIGKYLPNVIGIGSDGGGECYALDYRRGGEDPPLVQVPFGDLEAESVTFLGRSLSSWLAQVTA